MMNKAFVLWTASVLCLASGALAADSNMSSDQNQASKAMQDMKQDMKGEMKKLHDACKSDINQYCKDVTQGQGRIMACLKAHDDKLSSDCNKEYQSARNDMRAHWKSAHKSAS